MQMKEIGQTYQKNLLKALSEEFEFKIPSKRKIKKEKTIYRNKNYLELLESKVSLDSNNETLYSRIKRQDLINEREEIYFKSDINWCKIMFLELPGGEKRMISPKGTEKLEKIDKV